MKMLPAATIAALALGLTLSGTAARAADYPGRGNQDANTQQQSDQNDKNNRDHKGDKKSNDAETQPAQTAPAVVQPNNRAVNDDRRDNRNWNRNNRRNVDMRRWHRNYDSPRRYRADSYRAPRNYHYRRWSYGQHLPRSYYARDYWLIDFVMFGLLSPPDGYVWVRYGPDALLIDEETGEIIQVRYNVFYS